MKKRGVWVFAAVAVVGIAVAAGWWALRRPPDREAMEPDATHDHDGVVYYTCPMHPSVERSGPGTCPICGMDLTPVSDQDLEGGTVVVDDVRRQRIGVRTALVEKRPLVRTIRAVGRVHYDETRLSDINLRMSGWVQQLEVDETGQRVERGQLLFTLYSPELYAAQVEFLTATPGDENVSVLADLAVASKQRLRLLGMSDAQIRRLARRGKPWESMPITAPSSGYVIDKAVVEGAYVEAGTRAYRIADLSRVWIDADVYEADLQYIHVGAPVQVEVAHVGGEPLRGQVDYIYPTFRGETRTARVRVVLDNADLSLKPNMYADVFVDVDLGERLAVPESAVIYTGPRRLVFVDLGEGKLRPTEVEIGAHVDGYYEVLDGLQEGDRVVASGNFLISAESRIRSAVEFWRSETGHVGH